MPSNWALDAHVVRVVSRRRLLFEGAFVFFVDDDQAQSPGRREDGRSAPTMTCTSPEAMVCQ